MGADPGCRCSGGVHSLSASLDRVIQPSQRQLEGITLIEPIAQTIQSIQLHRGISAALLGGNETMRDRRAAQEKEAAAFDAMEGKLPAGLTSSENFRDIRTNWEQLRKAGLKLTIAENFTAHTNLIEQLQSFEWLAADEYLLMLDPELASFYLIDTLIDKLPHALEHLGQTRAYGTGILTQKQITSDLVVVFGQHGRMASSFIRPWEREEKQLPVGANSFAQQA